MVALLSDGLGRFNVQSLNIPVGDWADGYGPEPTSPVAPMEESMRTTAVADINGDGLR